LAEFNCMPRLSREKTLVGIIVPLDVVE
jgi:hypothetical protein